MAIHHKNSKPKMQIRTQRSTLIHSGFLFILFFNYFSCSVCHLLIKDGCRKLNSTTQWELFCKILFIKMGGKEYKSSVHLSRLRLIAGSLYKWINWYKLATFGNKSLFFLSRRYLFWVIFSITNSRMKNPLSATSIILVLLSKTM